MLCQHGRLECWECARAAIGNVHDTLITGDPMYKHGFSDGSSSVAELETQLAERDQLREQVAILREALLTCSVGDFSTGHVIYPSFDEKLVDEALAATEPK